MRDADTLPGKALALYRGRETPTLPILTAVNALWQAIQRNHPGVPEAAITLHADTRAHGHFAPGRWETKDGRAIHEIALSTYSLAYSTNDGAVVKTVSTLLHESAHAFAHATGQQDTSRQGRYHNGTFKRIAEAFGLIVEPNPTIGHVTTGVRPDALARYYDEIQNLTRAVTVYRRETWNLAGPSLTGGASIPTPAPKPRAPYGSKSVTIQCECGTEYRIPRALYESATIHCNECDSDYA